MTRSSADHDHDRTCGRCGWAMPEGEMRHAEQHETTTGAKVLLCPACAGSHDDPTCGACYPEVQS